MCICVFWGLQKDIIQPNPQRLQDQSWGRMALPADQIVITNCFLHNLRVMTVTVFHLPYLGSVD